jgi:hypothetical protein
MGTVARVLLRRVALRQRLLRFGRMFWTSFIVLAGVYAALLLCSRLLGVIPDRFHPISLVTLLAASAAVAAALYRRPSPAESARLVDERMSMEDLFLTSVLIDRSVGEYRPLVLGQAEQRAASISAQHVAPLTWTRRTRDTLLALAVLAAGIAFLPQLDPFGRELDRRQQAERRRELEESRKATQARLDMLKRGDETKLAQEVRKEVGDLAQTFKAMKPQQKAVNLRKLTERQTQLSDLWRKMSERNLKSSFRRTNQRLGQEGARKADQWRQELRRGEAAGMKREMSEMKQLAQKLQKSTDPVERQQLQQELERRLEDMKEFAAREMGADSMSAALSRAMDQLAMSGIEGLSSEALAGLEESLDLSQLEMEQLAQSLSDLNALEEALRAMQLAKMLNKWGDLDGKQCSQCKAMADYLALYQKLMEGRCPVCGGKPGDGVCSICGGALCSNCGACCGGCCSGGGVGVAMGPGGHGGWKPGPTSRVPGLGGGMKGPGTGRGGLAPEDDSAVTGFRPERSRSALQAGKTILSLKQSDVSDVGEDVVQYRQYVDQVKEGVSEAILHERVPAAYHDAVRGYFDSLEVTNEPSPEE